jgi:hypothetical protein
MWLPMVLITHLPRVALIALALFAFVAASSLLHPAYAEKSDNYSLNPLMSYREHIAELERLCRGKEADPECGKRQQWLKDTYGKLREVCRADRDDERCSLLMDERRTPGWSVEEFCFKNRHAKKCVMRRERAKRRSKMLQHFCAKNPDESRCNDTNTRYHKGFGNVSDYCKAKPDKAVCIAIAEKRQRSRPVTAVKANRF